MNTVEFLKAFRNRLFLKFKEKTVWSRQDIKSTIDEIYSDILEEIVGPKEIRRREEK